MTAHHAIEVHHQDAVLHILDDQAVDLLEVCDVDAALRRELFAGLGVATQQQRDADRGEVAETDQSRLQNLRGGYQPIDQSPAIDRDEHRTR